MGKKKQQKEAKAARTSEDKGKKTYSLPTTKTESHGQSSADSLQKVSIPNALEQELLDLIQTCNQQRVMDKEVSKRLTQKKLQDIYNSLNGAGFSHKQIEQAMENTILYGGDLVDALDWLCLNLSNDKLPANFSQALENEEEKKRPKFDTELVTDIPSNIDRIHGADKSAVKLDTKSNKSDNVKSQKDWILQYAEGVSDDDDDSDNKEFDPNEKYLEVTACLLDAKEEAALLKKAGEKSKVKEISKTIREMILEMESLEKHPDFNPQVKLQINDGDKGSKNSSNDGDANESDCVTTSHDTVTESLRDTNTLTEPTESKSKTSETDIDQPGDDDLGFSLFQQAEEEPPPKETKVVVMPETRSFEYTRQQWTGKSPKQFLNDWCRKHLQKSPPPKFHKLTGKGNTFVCRVVVDRRGKEGLLELTPDIYCGNIKEAEHLASTLALYHLCKGQSVYQLLPPPYRDVWLEWLDYEKQTQLLEKSKENKPRDQFLAKLMSKIQSSTSKTKTTKQVDDADDVIDSWENIDSDDEQSMTEESSNDQQAPQQGSSKSKHTKSVQDVYSKNQGSKIYSDLLTTRQELPVYKHKDYIIKTLQKHNVVLVAGETGSGKSTQVPHFILEDCLKNHRENCNIVCTEPRRISAISLASRVSQEMGESKLG
ncbi:ATP-dependent RNA helicase dhx29 [Mactra antiquata]